ncbi:MAG: hypothetical protein JW797_10005 [Bradymonadales bacterium]|nr:hypothetical protein [Bradymonadales bacterium]
MIWSLASIIALVPACGNGEDGTTTDTVNLQGAVQKGPFVVGSSVSVSLLDASLNPTGQVFNTQTINDRGEFEISFDAGGSAVALEGVGYYYNEVTGELSSSNLTLRAFYVPQGIGVQAAYINMVTHLTMGRIQQLVGAGDTFTDAVEQAEGELLTALAITASYEQSKAGVELTVTGGANDDNAYLLGVSSVLIQVAKLRTGSIEANLQELLNSFANDFQEDGQISGALSQEIEAALLVLDVDQVASNLAARFEDINVTYDVPDMHQVLDQDKDGVANHTDNCPLDANSLQENIDGDARGDACDDCPQTECQDEYECLPASVEQGRPNDICYLPCGGLDPSTDHTCPTDQRCMGVGGFGIHGICAKECDPFAPACAVGEHCGATSSYPMEDPEDLFGCIAEGIGGPGQLGDYCIRSIDCGAGLVCGAAGFPFFGCREICDLEDNNACDGLACTQITNDMDVQQPYGGCELPPGSQCDTCAADPEDTCLEDWVCVSSWNWDTLCSEVVSPNRSMEMRCVAGSGVGDACNTGGIPCAKDLICLHDGPGCEPDYCCVETGGADQPCQTDGSCDENLVCVYSNEGVAVGWPGIESTGYCSTRGGENEPCLPEDTCNEGLVCASGSGGVCSSGFEEFGCCVVGLGEGEHCDPDSGTPCAEGLSCVLDTSTYSCVPDGD